MASTIIIEGVPGKTKTLTSANAKQRLPEDVRFFDGVPTSPAISVLITCETADVRFTLGGSDPVPAGAGHVLASGNSVRIAGQKAVETFLFCNSTAGSNGVLQVTPFYMG